MANLLQEQNPHFDEGKLIWDDSYSGRYQPPSNGYQEQFDLQWKLALERFGGYEKGSGVRTDDDYIDDRIYEWTGVHPKGKNSFNDSSMGVEVLSHPIDPKLVQGKKCIDVACGMGRWTKTMLRLGAASVMSIDLSESGLKSVSQFNPNVRRVNIMNIPEEQPDLVGQFDFACFWGVAMCTHDPLKAFMSAASTVKSGGAIYLMVYCPEGIHALSSTNALRKRFHEIKDLNERLEFVEKLFKRKFDSRFPFSTNVINLGMNLFRWPNKGEISGYLDMLSPFYNWVISIDTINSWMKKAGFKKTVFLNENQRAKCGYHVLGYEKTSRKRSRASD